jgi:antitoxin PrlF
MESPMQYSKLLRRASHLEADASVLEQFLVFLANDISAHPDRLHSVGRDFVQWAQSLVSHVHVDLDASLTEKDE